MKILINSRELLKALTFVNKGISRKNSLPILDCLLLEQNDGVLKVSGGNSEINSSYKLEANGEDGRCAVNAKKLLDAIKSLGDTGIELVANDAKLICDYNSGKFELPTELVDEYPTFESIESEPIKVTNHNLRTLSQFTADNELRPVMNGVFFDFKNGAYCATDGHSLIKSTTSTHDVSFICPKNAIRLIDALSEFDLRLGSRVVQFNSDNIEVRARIIEGNYPHYNAVIPNNPIKVDVDRLSLINAIKRVSVFGNSSGLVKLEINDTSISISSQDLDYNTSAKESIPCSGEDITIGFNADRLTALLNSLEEDNITMELADKSRAMVIREGDNTLLLMPMMI